MFEIELLKQHWHKELQQKQHPNRQEPETEECSRCKGEGRLLDEVASCVKCEGTGRVAPGTNTSMIAARLVQTGMIQKRDDSMTKLRHRDTGNGTQQGDAPQS